LNFNGSSWGLINRPLNNFQNIYLDTFINYDIIKIKQCVSLA